MRKCGMPNAVFIGSRKSVRTNYVDHLVYCNGECLGSVKVRVQIRYF